MFNLANISLCCKNMFLPTWHLLCLLHTAQDCVSSQMFSGQCMFSPAYLKS